MYKYWYNCKNHLDSILCKRIFKNTHIEIYTESCLPITVESSFKKGDPKYFQEFRRKQILFIPSSKMTYLPNNDLPSVGIDKTQYKITNTGRNRPVAVSKTIIQVNKLSY